MPKTEPFDRYSEDYEKWFSDYKHVYLSEIEVIKNLIPKDGTGIEIGMGSGLFAEPLGISIGIEPSSVMRDLSVKRGLKPVAGVGEFLPFKNDIFDYALMVTAICFLDDPGISFREVKRITKNNGYFLVAFVDKGSPLGRIYQEMKNDNVFYSIAKFYSTEKVIALLKDTGFKIDTVVQSVFGNLDEIREVQTPREGYGEGGFVVVKGINTSRPA